MHYDANITVCELEDNSSIIIYIQTFNNSFFMLTMAPLAHGGESKNHEAPVLNMTSVGKRHCKNSPRKMRILGPSRFWDARYGVRHCTS
jgi:hypothetical protein